MPPLQAILKPCGPPEQRAFFGFTTAVCIYDMYYDSYTAGVSHASDCRGTAVFQFVQPFPTDACCGCKICGSIVHVCYSPCILEASVCLWNPWFFMVFSVYVGSDWNYLHGVCVGQAANHGPWALEVRNIVSASKHIEDFRFQADCHVWTETAATKTGQGKILKQMRKHATHVVFSAPAPSKQSGGPDVVGWSSSCNWYSLYVQSSQYIIGRTLA